MQTDEDYLPDPDDTVLLEEELKTFRIRITTVLTNFLF